MASKKDPGNPGHTGPVQPVRVVDRELRLEENERMARALQADGIDVSSPWDLIYVDGKEYAEAIPTLLRFVAEVREWDSLCVLSRLLRIKQARRGVPAVLYRKLAVSDTDIDDGEESMAGELAVTMAYVATPSDFEDLWGIVEGDRYSRLVRGAIIGGIVRLARTQGQRSKVEDFLLEQLGTAAEMKGWAGSIAQALGGLKSRRALPALRVMQTQGGTDFERRRAKQAVAKIEKSGSAS
ncbi:MAG: hypothetical protein AAF682_14670 [Planctomycetota bacterium]